MNSEILNERKNDLFGRKEVEVSVEVNSTPTHEDAQKIITEKLSTPLENVTIKKIENRFGSNNFLVKAFIYDSEEQKNKIEPKPKTKKKE